MRVQKEDIEAEIRVGFAGRQRLQAALGSRKDNRDVQQKQNEKQTSGGGSGR